MHESEKSDSVVVAGKPTNKTARAVAEPVEPRTGTATARDGSPRLADKTTLDVGHPIERGRRERPLFDRRRRGPGIIVRFGRIFWRALALGNVAQIDPDASPVG